MSSLGTEGIRLNDWERCEQHVRLRFYRQTGKRIVDVAGAVLLLAVSTPILLFTWLLVRVRLGRPVLFRQSRPGLHGDPFVLVKFRSMRDLAGQDGQPRADAERLTRVGRLLRAASLDELPTLWNVLVGDMSMVGPRPLLMEYLPRYNPEQARRHEVKPGITGWAQVNGRNALTWEEKFKFDVWYVDHCSIGLDLRILGMTLVKALKGEGISAEGHATMPVFTGSKGNTDG